MEFTFNRPIGETFTDFCNGIGEARCVIEAGKAGQQGTQNISGESKGRTPGSLATWLVGRSEIRSFESHAYYHWEYLRVQDYQ